MKLIYGDKVASIDIIPGPDDVWAVLEQVDEGKGGVPKTETFTGTFDEMQDKYVVLRSIYLNKGWKEINPTDDEYENTLNLTIGFPQNQYTLYVDGDTHIKGNLTVDGDMTVDGIITCKDVIATG